MVSPITKKFLELAPGCLGYCSKPLHCTAFSTASLTHLLITTIVTNPEGSGVSPTRSNLSLVFVLHQCLILVNAMALCIRMCSVLYPWWIQANYYDMG